MNPKYFEKDYLIQAYISDQDRAEKCLAEIKSILEKYECTMEPVFTMSSKGISSEIKIIPNIREPIG